MNKEVEQARNGVIAAAADALTAGVLRRDAFEPSVQALITAAREQGWREGADIMHRKLTNYGPDQDALTARHIEAAVSELRLRAKGGRRETTR